jgi:hypothetical protein
MPPLAKRKAQRVYGVYGVYLVFLVRKPNDCVNSENSVNFFIRFAVNVLPSLYDRLGSLLL